MNKLIFFDKFLSVIIDFYIIETMNKLKFTIYIFLLISIINCTNKESNIFIIDEFGNKISVKSLKNKKDYFKYEYDNKGNLKAINYYDSNGLLKYSYKYDEETNLKERLEYVNNEPKSKIEYDKKGFKTKEYIFDNSSDYRLYNYEYENNKLKIKKEYYVIEDNPIFISYEEYVYDLTTDKRIKNITYDSNNNIIQTTEYNDKKIVETRYDEKGNVTYLYEKNKDNNIESYTYYKNDKVAFILKKKMDTNSVEQLFYNDKGIKTKFIELDKNGNKIKEGYFDKDGNITNYVVIEYDDKGKQIKKADFRGENKLKRYYKYIYNEKGIIEKIQAYDSDGNLIEYE